ncbi:MAG: pyrroline-5-carboxylate reductase [Coriobacteriales bacterium]|nr:pyrroline-5-carboxylate reductase [Coriobacteriales bacterium]
MDDRVALLGRIAIIGGGKMGEAIVAGLVNGAMFDPASIIIADPGEERREYLSDTYGISCVADGARIAHPTTVLLAVKPQVLREVCASLRAAPSFTPTRIVSIAAGITTATLRSLFPEGAIIRVMPNAPLMVGAGMSTVCVSADTPRAEGELVRELFSLMGDAVLLDESLINAATALSGSGPAYFALFVEELAKAGERAGLKPEDASLLAIQTLRGTARYLELTEASPAELRAAVTSPGGTTQAALETFENTQAHGLSQLVTRAVEAALKRAEELA